MPTTTNAFARTARRLANHLYPGLCIVLVVLSGGCGRKAAPRPPEDVQPAVIADLEARDTAGGIELTWSRPKRYRDGSRMSDLAGFLVERSSGTEPETAYSEIGRIEVTDRERFQQQSRFRIVDAHTIVGNTYRYRVVSYTTDEYLSEPSNVASVERKITTEETHAPLPAPQR